MNARAIASAFARGILAGSLSILAVNPAPAQPISNSLTSSPDRGMAKESLPQSPASQQPGLRMKKEETHIASGLSAEQRGDILMARKMYRAAADSYQEELVVVTARRAEMLRRNADSLRKNSRDGEARAAERAAAREAKSAAELRAKQQYLPGSGSNFFSRLLAAFGMGGHTPGVPEDTSQPSPVTPVPAELAALLKMPKNLDPGEQAGFLAANGRHAEAMEIYDGLLRRDQRKQAILWNKIGIAYHQLVDLPAAVRCYGESSSVDPLYAEARNNLGAAYHAQKQYSRAIAEYKKALVVAPYSASIHGNLGTAYLGRKQYEEASLHYARAIELDPMIFERRGGQGTILQERGVEDRASLHFHLAKIYARKGDLDRSLLYIRKALEEGFKDRKKFVEDEDFAALQAVPEFQTLLATEFRVL